MNNSNPDSDGWADRAERLAVAAGKYHEVMTTRGPDTSYAYFDAGVVGFVFAEMWTRPGLTRKERRWITLACVAAAGATAPIQTHVYAALNSGDCTLQEMDEFGLHIATQLGWPKGQPVNMHLMQAVQQIAGERGEQPRTPDVIRWADPAKLAERVARGRKIYEEVMLSPAPEALTVFRRVGYLAYLYGEVWSRPGLTRKERRIISICCAAQVGVARELDDHLYAALVSGDLTTDELEELVLHYAVYLGWTQGAALDDTMAAVVERVQREQNGS